MNAKFLMYIGVAIAVIWSLESVNINQLFKKNRFYQARVFYIMIIFSITYLVSNFIIDFINCLK